LLATTVSAICAASFSVKAQSSASGSMILNSLTVSPASGSIAWSSGWSLGAVSVTGNSDGGLGFGYDFESSPASASAAASAPYASASSTATATSLDPSGVSGQVSGAINIPGGINESAFVSGGYGNYASLAAQFTLSQSTWVSLGAVITAAQSMQTDAGGQVLQNEVIFGLYVDSSASPSLFYDNALTLGPGSFYSTGPSPFSLSASIDLGAGSHDVYLELDDEQQVLETSAPDGGNTCLILAAALGSLAAVKAMGGRGALA
jgi:hypothetical protein